MTVLQAAGGGSTEVQARAVRGESSATRVATGAPGGNDGAAQGGRGKLIGMAAVSVRQAIDALDRGDVSGARGLLAAVIDDLP